MLNYAFICSRVQYGISVSDTATKTKLREVEIRLNNILRNIRFSSVTNLNKKLDCSKLNDICKFELAKYMRKLFNDKLPKIFQIRFVKTLQLYSH